MFIALCALMLAACDGVAQNSLDSVDRKKVEMEVNDASLASFYPTLLDRFNAFDTTLTLAEYRLLYYGFVFQPDYSIGMDHQKKEMNDAFRAGRYQEVIQLADSVLARIPVSMTAHYFRAYAMINAGDRDSSSGKYIRRYTGIKNAILSSGDGRECSTAFKTIFVEDEYEIMFHHFEIDIDISHSFQFPCDRFSVTPSGTFQNAEIYFDTSESVRLLEKQLHPR